MHLSPDEAAVLVVRVRSGDAAAWDLLVESYAGLVWAIARNHRLGSSDAADVSQTTWLRLVENLDRIEDPRRVGAWLATTARRECLRVLRLSGREVLVFDDAVFDRGDAQGPDIDHALLRAESAASVTTAFARLPDRCQQLLRVLMLDEAPHYEAVSSALDMPVGSIGPTRSRCLAKLRVLLEEGGATTEDR